jgi:hypothetical protein
LTGAYNSSAHIIDVQNNTNSSIEIKFMEKRGKGVGIVRPYRGRRIQAAWSSPGQI